MKTRILSAAVGIIVAVVILTLNVTRFPWLLNIAVAVVACMALYELLVATKFIDNAAIVITSFAATAFIQFIPAFPEDIWIRLFSACGVVYFIALFCIMLCSHKKLHVERLGLAFMATALIALPFFSMLYMYWKNPYDKGEFHYIGQALVILCFLLSWFTDAGAYFVGTFCGKHKLAPEISPKKTVEGMIGGFVCCVGLVALVGYLFTGPLELVSFDINWLNLLLVTVVSSVISVIGDLSFSIIKRAFDIKDFGKIMPGHGGVLDRFDSVIFVSPVVCIMNMFLPIIIVK
ncbi:MAG: hypothetical protein E7559_00885 [Ruminococcaceae bacterium]|nr:hypothetical protein [Oscillospiraceae bacterium]